MTSMPKRKLMNKRRIGILVVALMVLAAMVASGIAGCGATGTIVYDCNYPLQGRLAHDGQHDACCHIDACPCHCLNDPCPDFTLANELANELACELAGDAGTDASVPEGGTSACDGTCAPILPLGGWEGPSLLWLGPEGMEPTCPAEAPVIAYQGHDGLLAAPTSCGTCVCSTPSGTCAPPLTLTASSKPQMSGHGVRDS